MIIGMRLLSSCRARRTWPNCLYLRVEYSRTNSPTTYSKDENRREPMKTRRMNRKPHSDGFDPNRSRLAKIRVEQTISLTGHSPKDTETTDLFGHVGDESFDNLLDWRADRKRRSPSGYQSIRGSIFTRQSLLLAHCRLCSLSAARDCGWNLTRLVI